MSVEIEPRKEETQTESTRTLRSLIDDFDKQGAHPALINFGSKTSDTVSYGSLLQSIRQMAAGFAERGLKQGDSVVVFAPNSPSWVKIALAVIYFGGTVVPVDSQQSDEVLKHIVEDSAARFVCTDAKGAERLSKQLKDKSPDVIRMDNDDDLNSWRGLCVKALPASALPTLKPDDFTLLFYTSGTTGMPKGVPLTHGNILLQLDSVISKTDLLRPDDRVLAPLPFFHVYPLNIGLFAPLLMGLPVILPRSLTGPEIKRAINEGKVTVVIGVPRLLRSLYQAIETKFYAHKVVGLLFDFLLTLCGFFTKYLHIKLGKIIFAPVHKQLGPTLRMFTSGGAPLEAPMAAKFKALGFDLACGYGLTETSPLLALRMPDDNDLEGAGEAIAGVELRIVPLKDGDESGADVKEGQGEIQARGPNVFSGYRNLPEKTKEAFSEDGWFRTGDLGYFKGKELHIVGRASSTIVMEGGEKIQPDDIEDRLSKLPGIGEIALLQKDHKLVALVVPDPEAEGGKVSRETISTQLKQAAQAAASYLAITDFAMTETPLPRTNLGKIKRFELNDLYDRAKADDKSGKDTGKGGGGQVSAQDQALLADPAAQKCFDWLKGRFPNETVTFDTSPQLDLGIDSLEWMNLTLELLEQTGVELTAEAIARVSTVRDLLTEVTAAGQDGGTAGEGRLSPVEDPESYLDDKQMTFVQPQTPAELKKARWLFDLVMFLMRPFDVEAVGLDKLPAGQFVLVSNHVSYIDAFAIIAAIPYVRLQKTQWAGWVGIAFANPLVSYLSRLGQIIPIDASHSPIASLAMPAMALKSGKNLVWFPEGERALDGKLLEFKPGIGVLLDKISVPVVPVYLEGTAEALPPGHYWPTKHKIRVIFGDPVDATTLAAEGEKISRAEAGGKGGGDQTSSAAKHRMETEAKRKAAALAKNKEGGPVKDGADASKTTAGVNVQDSAVLSAADKPMTRPEQIAAALRLRVAHLAGKLVL
jgi:long-chain acyl-CoA synthetase